MKSPLSFLPAAGVGVLLGCLLPVMQPQAPVADPVASAAPVVHPASPPVVIEMPADDPIAWAAEFGTSHPQEFFQWLLKQNPQPKGDLVRAFFHAWIEHDPDAAFKAALKLPARFRFGASGEDENRFFVEEVKGLLDRHPAAAFRWIGRVEQVIGLSVTMNFNVPFENSPELTPEEVAKYANQSLPGQATEVMICAYGRYLLEKRGLSDCIAWMKTLNPEHQGAIMEAVCLEWGKTDPGGVMKYLEETTSSVRQYKATELMNQVTYASPTKAMEWLEQHMGATSYTGLNNMLEIFDHSDAEGAQKYVMGLEDKDKQLDAIKGLGESHTMRSKVPETMQWVATLPADLQVEATAGAMRWRLGSDYISFLTPLSDNILAPEIQDRYIQQLADGIGQGMMWDEKAAIHQWLDDHPGEVRDAFVKATVTALEKKPDDLNKFLSYLPEAEANKLRGTP